MFNTLNLKQAAELVKLHPVTLQGKAKAGEIPAAKPGKCWVFIEADLIEWLRAQYTSNRQDASREEKQWYSKEKVVPIGITNSPSREKRYSEALAPKTKGKPKK